MSRYVPSSNILNYFNFLSIVTSEHDQQQQWATSSAPVLHPGLDISQHLELVPPDVYKTLFLWYGGGPQVSFEICETRLVRN